MSQKRPDIGNLLNRPHLSHNNDAALAPDPMVRTRIIATIENTVPFNRNPRQSKNPLYEEIKESIRNIGLEHPPVVTRKSPADPYMIKKGGNTRLNIMKELWEETHDLRFYKFECDFEPYTNELDSLVSHMVENEMKGNTLFIEKAIGAVEIKKELEAQLNESLSIRELARKITGLGWSINDSNLNQMLHAHEHLFPVIPEAFWSGMGRDAVKKIRKLLETCKTFWESVAKPEEGIFDEVWKPVFKLMDGEGFDVDKAEYELCSAMSAKLNAPVMSLRAEVQAIGEGLSKGGTRPTDIIGDSPNANIAKQRSTPQPLQPKNPPTIVAMRTQTIEDLQEIESDKSSSDLSPHAVDEQNNSQPIGNNLSQHPYSDVPHKHSQSEFSYLLDYEVSSLKELAYQAALDYADTYGISEYVEYLDDTETWHTGFDMKPPIEIDDKDNLLLPWATLWSFSNALNSPKIIFEELDKYLTRYLTKDTLLIILALLPNFKGQLMGHQMQDPAFEPVRWKMLSELEAIISLLVDYKNRWPEKLFFSDEEVL